MKKISVLLALMLAMCSFTACGENNDSDEKDAKSSESEQIDDDDDDDSKKSDKKDDSDDDDDSEKSDKKDDTTSRAIDSAPESMLTTINSAHRSTLPRRPARRCMITDP